MNKSKKQEKENKGKKPKQLNLKIKKLTETAITPSYAKIGDAGLNFYADSYSHNKFPKFLEVNTGISVEIPEGYVGLIFDRSSVTNKLTPFGLKNSVGVIDSGYRGEIKFRFNYPDEFIEYFATNKLSNNVENIDKFWKDINNNESGMYGYWEIGYNIGQMVIVEIPKVNIIEVDELSESDRGEGGFGSTNKS